MGDPVDRAMQEVWDWKRQAEEATQDMSKRDLIEFYRAQADQVQRRLGLDLLSLSATDAANRRQRA